MVATKSSTITIITSGKCVLLSKSKMLPFPDHDDFFDSIWADWKKRIENVHEKDLKKIMERHERQMNQFSNSNFDPDAEADYFITQACKLTNTMYAGLIVAMWSEIESFLKRIISICAEAYGKRVGITKIKNFCEDLLEGKEPDITLDDCIEILDKMKGPNQFFKFKELKKALKYWGIKVEQC